MKKKKERIMMMMMGETIGMMADGHAIDDRPVIKEQILMHEASLATDFRYQVRHANIYSVSILIVVQ